MNDVTNRFRFFLLFMVVFLLIVISLACGKVSNQGGEEETLATAESTKVTEKANLDVSVTETISALPTKQTTSTTVPSPTPTNKPTSTRIPTNTPKPTKPQAAMKLQWTIKTGDLRFLGVAADGTIYGINKDLYAVISPEGNVIKTDNLNLSDCVRSNFSGGSGAQGITAWFAVNSEGTVISYAYVGGQGPCVIYPGDPPVVQFFNRDFNFSPYSDDGLPREWPAWPEGFRKGGFHSLTVGHIADIFWFDDSRDEFEFRVNVDTMQAGYINSNGGLSIFDLPDDLDFSKTAINAAVTPWDEVYYWYKAYDSLGNEVGKKFVRVYEDGYSTNINSIPSQLTSSYAVTYLPFEEAIYFLSNKLEKYNTGLRLIISYPLPSSFEFSRDSSYFVGNDGAFYVFDISEYTLSKYLLVGGD